MSLASLKKNLLLQLLYSEVFRHPLTLSELSGTVQLTSDETITLLNELVDAGLVEQSEGFYAVSAIFEKVKLRKQGMERAENLREKSWKVGQFIQRFPFVEGVGISGSLSKGILHEDGDFDYFIITKSNRLWIARTLLILYKKIFLLNSRKYFCVNYFIDDQNLEIEEKNRFTATEIQTLIPVTGSVFHDFHQANNWVREFYPGNEFLEIRFPKSHKPAWSRCIMWTLHGKLGEWADMRCMKITFRRWKKKFSYFQNEKFELTLRTRRYISKHHPNDFQTKVLNRHQELIADYRQQYATQLTEQGIEL